MDRCPERQLLTYKTTDRNGYRHFKSSPVIYRQCAARLLHQHCQATAAAITSRHGATPSKNAARNRRAILCRRQATARPSLFSLPTRIKVACQCLLATAAQNIKRSRSPSPASSTRLSPFNLGQPPPQPLYPNLICPRLVPHAVITRVHRFDIHARPPARLFFIRLLLHGADPTSDKGATGVQVQILKTKPRRQTTGSFSSLGRASRSATFSSPESTRLTARTGPTGDQSAPPSAASPSCVALSARAVRAPRGIRGGVVVGHHVAQHAPVVARTVRCLALADEAEGGQTEMLLL